MRRHPILLAIAELVISIATLALVGFLTSAAVKHWPG